MPFTKVFEKARSNKGGKPINPNDPLENTEAFGLNPEDPLGRSAPAGSQLPHSRQGQEASKDIKETGQEVSARKQTPESHAQRFLSDANHQNLPSAAYGSQSRAPSELPPRRAAQGLEIPRGPSGSSSGARTADRSQGRSHNKPSAESPIAGSPTREIRSSQDGGTLTPQRSRHRSSSSLVKTEPEKAASLPKFGDWNPNDLSAGQGFTMIFNNARNEKKIGGPVQIPPLQAAQSAPQANPGKININSQQTSSKWYCCFGSSEIL
ncbi:hypothetical protein O6H91_09G024800 [Diphasiastrum complanatum]|nr:hypothetical protein O6H91_09G024800 [Diphasiastrum complanatum]